MTEPPTFRHPAWTAQHIGIAWVSAASTQDRGADRPSYKVVEHFDGGKSIDFRLQDLTRPDGPALRFIDCYGDTLFNFIQIAAFLEELRDIRTRVKEPDLLAHIDALVEFASRDMQPHSFLWFIGD